MEGGAWPNCARRQRFMPQSRRCGRPSTSWSGDRTGTVGAAAGHAGSVVGFFCSTYGGGVTGVRVNEGSFMLAMATIPGDDVVDVTVAVGPDGRHACRVSTADGHVASVAPDVRVLEQVLAGRWVEGSGDARPRLAPTRVDGGLRALRFTAGRGRRST